MRRKELSEKCTGKDKKSAEKSYKKTGEESVKERDEEKIRNPRGKNFINLKRRGLKIGRGMV